MMPYMHCASIGKSLLSRGNEAIRSYFGEQSLARSIDINYSNNIDVPQDVNQPSIC